MIRRQKIALILALVALSLPTFLTEIVAYSAEFRDSFFYADFIVADHILSTGHVMKSPFSSESFMYWGKIGTRTNQPLLPIYMTIGTLVTGLDLYIFHSHIPTFVIIFVVYYVLIRQFVEAKVALPTAFAAGAIAPYLGANSAGLRGVKIAVYFLIIFILIRRTQLKQVHPGFSVLLPLALIHLLFNKPRLFVISSFFIILCGALFFIYDQHVPWASIGVTGAGIWVVFATPFRAYSKYVFISAGQFIPSLSALESSRLQVEVLQPSTFGFPIHLPTTLLIGLFGGLIALSRAKSSIDRGTVSKYAVLVCWGFALMGFVGVQLISGEFWLISRSIGDAFPIMIAGSAITMNKYVDIPPGRSNDYKKIAFLVLVLLLLIPVGAGFVERSYSPIRDVHSYQNGDILTDEWIISYAEPGDKVLSDMQRTALLVGDPVDGVYPLSESTIRSTFYSGEFSTAPDHDYLWLDKEMVRKGLYVPPFPRNPVNAGQYSGWIERKDIVYTNGDSKISWSV